MTVPFRHVAAAAVIATVALAGCKRNDADVQSTATTGNEPASSRVEPVSPSAPMATDMGRGQDAQTALNVTSVTLGTEAGDDMSITDPTTTFKTVGPIVVSVATNGAASNVDITARLVYQDGQQAGEETETVNTTGMETTNFTFSNAEPWPTGNYTAEVLINGTQAQSKAFTIR
jgi:hypothetical protein